MSVKLVSDEKIAETSSKGNQEKWLDNGVWYKLDQFGYESLAETLVSQLLCQSNIEQDTPFKFVRYDISRVIAHGRERLRQCGFPERRSVYNHACPSAEKGSGGEYETAAREAPER